MASFEKRGKKWRAVVSTVEGANRVKRTRTRPNSIDLFIFKSPNVPRQQKQRLN
ncbi:hypothetical protein ACT5YT_05035 [Leuconostoc suionicum]|uniref:hypothetical protein n=1 Tax=Leuconostoc suionicum TaxID=1511761 RepID=UPI0040356875